MTRCVLSRRCWRDPFDYQTEFLRTLAAGRRMRCKSGTALEKVQPRLGNAVVFVVRYPCKVVVTAPTSSQLFDAMFAELKRWVNELPKELQAAQREV